MPTTAEKIDQAISLLAQARAELGAPSAPPAPPSVPVNQPGMWVPLGGVLPDQSGNKAPMPRCFDTHRIIWEAAQRGDPVAEGRPPVAVEGINGWPGPDGKAFRIAEYQRLGTQAVLDAINWLDSESPECAAWKASPAVAPFLPKSPPAMFPLSR
jgi:hypothetical protein